MVSKNQNKKNNLYDGGRKMAITAFDNKMNIRMFVETMGDRFKSFLASKMTPEEKLNKIIEAMEKDVQEKRVLARQIGAQMRAIADPDTVTAEPLEAMIAARKKRIVFGAGIMDNPKKKAQFGQVQQEIKSLDARIKSQQGTYDTLVESHALAKASYHEAFNALETIRLNGPAMIKAIQAQKNAVEMRDKAAGQKKIDTSFLGELEAELNNSRAELREDKAIDDDLDAMNESSIDDALAKMDAESVDDSLMAEFRAAAAAKK